MSSEPLKFTFPDFPKYLVKVNIDSIIFYLLILKFFGLSQEVSEVFGNRKTFSLLFDGKKG